MAYEPSEEGLTLDYDRDEVPLPYVVIPVDTGSRPEAPLPERPFGDLWVPEDLP